MTRVLTFPPLLVLICGGIILMLNLGVRSGYGLFVEGGMRDAFVATGGDWSMGVFGLAFAIQNLVWGAFSIVGGMIADRFGMARTVALGLVLYATGWALQVVSDQPLIFYLTSGVLVGVGTGLTSFSLVLAAIGRAFPPEKRSMALGIAAALGSFGQVTLTPLGQILIEAYDWQTGLFVTAALVALCVPLAVVLSGNAQSASGGVPLTQSLGQALREAFGERSFALLCLGFFVCGFHIAFIVAHMPTFIAMCGLPPSVAGLSLAIVGLFNILGTLLSGYLAGRVPKRYVLSGIYALRGALILVFLVSPKTELVILAFSAVMGLLWLSTVPATSGIVAHIFGPTYMASLFGFVMFSHQLGAFFGAWLGGVVLDATGSYDLVWMISAGLGFFAAVINLPIREVALVRPAPVAAFD